MFERIAYFSKGSLLKTATDDKCKECQKKRFDCIDFDNDNHLDECLCLNTNLCGSTKNNELDNIIFIVLHLTRFLLLKKH
jgi:hypothetical protein